MVLIAENRDGDVDGRNGAVRLRLGFAELDRPASVAVLVAEFGRIGLPALGDAPLYDRLLFILGSEPFLGSSPEDRLFGRKPFIDAQASTSVPSTEK